MQRLVVLIGQRAVVAVPLEVAQIHLAEREGEQWQGVRRLDHFVDQLVHQAIGLEINGVGLRRAFDHTPQVVLGHRRDDIAGARRGPVCGERRICPRSELRLEVGA